MADDVDAFIAQTAGSEEGSSSGRPSRHDYYEEERQENKAKMGQVVQYANYGAGYTATSSTVTKLPAAVYDINADNRCVYVTPALKPSGLLLELPEMRSEEVISVVENFWNSEENYKKGNANIIGGASYKSGILVFGPPGSGKSCTLKILSKKLVERGGTVFFSSGNPNVTLSWLSDFARIEKDRKCIVILEDIDSLIQVYGESGYLEMLDSAKTIDNVIFIATTNYPDRLDQRFYNRPGRLCHVIHIGLPTDTIRAAYLKAILKGDALNDIPLIVAETQGFTIDHLTALTNGVYREGKNLEQEMARLRKLFRVPKSDDLSQGISLSAGFPGISGRPPVGFR